MSWLLDPNLALLGFIGLTCVIALVRTFGLARSQAWEVRIVSTIVLAGGGLAYVLVPRVAGYVALVLWGALVLAPGVIGQRIVRSVHQRRYARAARLARVVAILRPRGDWRDAATFYGALDAVRAGRRAEGAALLDRIAQGTSGLATSARAERLASDGAWQQLKEELERRPDGFEMSLLPRYVRALGELGEPSRMLHVIGRAGARLDGASTRWIRYPVLLFAFAFSGRPERVAELLRGPLRHFDAPARALWLATAHLAAGETERARALLRDSYAGADALLARSFDARLAAPPPLAATALDDGARRVLAALEREWDGERRYAPDAASAVRPVVTWGIVVALFAVYALEVAKGGATNDQTLLALGALVPDRALAQPWRVVTAQFLHYGPVHISLNVLGLLVLGGFAERTLGRARYLVAYLLSGTLALAMYVVLARLGITAPEMLIGASGNIMGIVGASAAIVAHGWWLERAPAARRHLTMIVLIVALQAVIDLTVPGISFAAHALGAAFGFIIVGFMVGVAPARVLAIGTVAILLSVAGERFASRQARRQMACRGSDLSACESSCAEGQVQACTSLGLRYDTGDGVAVDKARAVHFYTLGCDGAQAVACNNLGTLVDVGAGTPEDPVAAARWFRKACDMDDAYGCRNLGLSALKGDATPEDEGVARKALAKQCAAADKDACHILDELGPE